MQVDVKTSEKSEHFQIYLSETSSTLRAIYVVSHTLISPKFYWRLFLSGTQC